MNMGKIFERAVARFPERPALVDGDTGERYTYQEWSDRVRTLASALTDAGVEPHDRVGAVMCNRAELASLYWATQLLGAVFVPYNFRATTDELAFLINNTNPRLLFFSGISREMVENARSEVAEVKRFVYVDVDGSPDATSYEDFLAHGEPGTFEPTFIDTEATSFILHTAGTTGRPKGVPRSHKNTYAGSTAHAIQHRWEDGVCTLDLMPMYHTMGIHTLTTTLLLNGKLVTQRSFDPEQTTQIIRNEHLSSLYLVPTVFHDLTASNAIENTDTSSVEKISYAGIPMSSSVQKTVRDTFEPESFVNHFGSTEVYTYSICHWLDEKPGCAGRADINTELRIVTAKQDKTVSPTETVDQGEQGEIIIDASSPEALNGYLDDPEADENSFEDGWYFTGDLGYKDNDGDLFVVGRVDDMIITGGENVYPVEVEDVLETHDNVAEVAVAGQEHQRWNQVVTAFVRPSGATDTLDYESLAGVLDKYCRERNDLADYKRPRKYVFVDGITKSNVGKILRRELVDQEFDAEIDVGAL